jgi:hypothetical protein
VDWVHETMNQLVLQSTMGLKWRRRNISHWSFARRPVPVGKTLLLVGGNGEGGIQVPTGEETRRGSCKESRAVVKYRLDG